MPSHLITLDVSGEKYQTRKITLQTSPYFQSLMDSWDDSSDRQEDGSYFVDADSDTFQYILEFMRRPSKFPLFWTKETSFDYELYNKLEAEADYFLLHDLRDWIRKKRYLDAVKTIVEVKVFSEHELKNGRNHTMRAADIEVQSFFGSYSGEKGYHSPCEIHGRNVRACDDCTEIRQAHGPQYDDPPKRLTVVTKRIDWDETVCVNETVS